MVDIINWPCSQVRPLNGRYFLRYFDRTAGTSIVGGEQILSSGIARWEIELHLPRTFRGDDLRRFEVMVNQMRGRRNIAALCICDPYRYGDRNTPRHEPFSDGTYFSDGTGFMTTQSQDILTASAVAAGATTLTINTSPPAIPNMRPGDMFSHNGFLYRVLTAVNPGTVSFEPPARRAIPAGASLRTDPPQIYVRFSDSGQGARMREFMKWGEATTLSFIEAFDR